MLELERFGEPRDEEEIEGSQVEECEVGMGWRNYWFVRWARSNIYDPFLLIFRRGTEPKQLAMSAALGTTLGIFPIYGVTVFMCGAAAAILGRKCHVPTLMLANLMATPLEFSLVVPFMRIGERLLGGSPFLLSKDALWQAVTFKASSKVLYAILHALVGWLIASPFLFLAVYIFFLPLVRWSRRYFDMDNHPISQRLSLLNEEVVSSRKDVAA